MSQQLSGIQTGKYIIGLLLKIEHIRFCITSKLLMNYLIRIFSIQRDNRHICQYHNFRSRSQQDIYFHNYFHTLRILEHMSTVFSYSKHAQRYTISRKPNLNTLRNKLNMGDIFKGYKNTLPHMICNLQQDFDNYNKDFSIISKYLMSLHKSFQDNFISM